MPRDDIRQNEYEAKIFTNQAVQQQEPIIDMAEDELIGKVLSVFWNGLDLLSRN